MLALDTVFVKPGALDQFESTITDRFYSNQKSTKLISAWRVDIGRLSTIMQLWSPGEDPVTQLPSLSVELENLVTDKSRRILTPAPFSPPGTVVKTNLLYEIRLYRYSRNAIDRVIEKWERKIDDRIALSPLLFCGYTNTQPVSDWVHIWPYKNLSERDEVRGAAIHQGLWPPGAFGGLIEQETCIVRPVKIFAI